jgi:MFS family permease
MSKSDSKSVVPPPVKLSTVHWLICIIASIGFAFDIYEILMLPLIGKGAIGELVPAARNDSNLAYFWRMMLFFVPAVVGGIFGLLGGYLTDRLGRRRVLTWSIILYAVSAFLAGYSTNIYMLLTFRCLIFIGVCVEFVAAVAWLAELFPNPSQRERVLGYTQAFSSIGGLLAAVIYGLILSYKSEFPRLHIPEGLQSLLGKISNDNAEWRYMLMSGLLPAIPLLVIRPFLPESPAWQAKRQQGTLRRPSFAQLFAPDLSKTTIVTAIMVACSYGVAFGAIQQIQEIIPWFPQVVKKVADNQAKSEAVKKAKEEEQAPAAPDAAGSRNAPDAGQTPPAAPGPKTMTPLQKAMLTAKLDAQNKYASEVTKVQEVGGLVGRFIFSFVALWFASRRNLLRFFTIPGLIITPLVFWYASVDNPTLFTIDIEALGMPKWEITVFHLGIFAVALFTVAQFSYWGNYLPLVYPVHLRGTGESFAMNIGGRLLGTACSGITLITASLLTPKDGGPLAGPKMVAIVAACVGLGLYLLINLMTFTLPEPKEEEIER